MWQEEVAGARHVRSRLRARLGEHAGPEAGERIAQGLVLDAPGHAAGGFEGGGRGWRHPVRAGFTPLDRPLAQDDPADATPAKPGIDPLAEHGGEVLDLDGEGPLDPQDQCRRLNRGIGRPFDAARGPLELERFGDRCEAFTGDFVPVQDDVRLAEPLFGQHGIDRRADEIGEGGSEGLAPGGWTPREFGNRLHAIPLPVK